MSIETRDFPAIVLGTYEEFLLGFQPEFINQKYEMTLKQSFATHSHKASIRCVASYGRYLLSSGADEIINVYDVVKKKILKAINFHKATVTSLEFVPDGSHFVSGNQNGDIAIFSCKDWSVVKYWKQAHKCPNGVLSVSVHPTGSLLMSASANNTMRFWNLIKGRQVFVVNTSKKCPLGSTLNFAKWSKTGNYFAVCIGKLAEVYHTESAVLKYNTRSETRYSTIEFLSSDNILLGMESGVIQIHSMKKEKMLHQEKCHDARIKCMIAFQRPSKTDADKKFTFLVTADSQGVVKLWRLRIRKSKYTLVLKTGVDIDCRITSMAIIEQGVHERDDDDEDDEEDEDGEEGEGEEKGEGGEEQVIETLEEAVEEAVEETVETLEEAVEETVEALEETAEALEETVEALEETVEALEETAEALEETVEEAMEEVMEETLEIIEVVEVAVEEIVDGEEEEEE